jgi:hypothetical protein
MRPGPVGVDRDHTRFVEELLVPRDHDTRARLGPAHHLDDLGETGAELNWRPRDVESFPTTYTKVCSLPRTRPFES